MSAKKMKEEQLRFAEEMGILMEKSGHPRIAGKILGFLLISPEPYSSGEDLARHLKASKGSISTMTRFLIQLGLLEKIGVPGDRRDFFTIRPGTFGSLLHGRMTQVTEFRQILEKGLRLVPDRTSDAYGRLTTFHRFYEFFEKEFSALTSRWEEFQLAESQKRIQESQK